MSEKLTNTFRNFHGSSTNKVVQNANSDDVKHKIARSVYAILYSLLVFNILKKNDKSQQKRKKFSFFVQIRF